MTRVVLLRSPLTQRVRNFVVKHGFSIPVIRHAIANRLSGIQINYSDSPLNMGSARGLRGPEPGQRLISGRSAGRDDVPRFILLARNSAEARVMIARHSDLLASEVRLPPDGNGIWLVRPDGYVAAAAKSGDWKVIDMA